MHDDMNQEWRRQLRETHPGWFLLGLVLVPIGAAWHGCYGKESNGTCAIPTLIIGSPLSFYVTWERTTPAPL